MVLKKQTTPKDGIWTVAKVEVKNSGGCKKKKSKSLNLKQMDLQKEDYTDNVGGRGERVMGVPPLHWHALETSLVRQLEQVEPEE